MKAESHMKNPTTIVFFSWQSDTEQDVTTQAIRKSARAAFAELETKHECNFQLDEATRNMPGALNIPITLIEKIKNSDIFVADITSVTRDDVLEKAFPNPNVTFELGYAVAHLGWARIILLFNKSIAEFKDLPFDFDRQRISTYVLPHGSKKPSDFKPLNNLVHAALDIIAVQKPKRPRELEGKSEAEIKKERDARELRHILSLVSTSLIDQHLQQMPDHIYYSAACISDYLQSAIYSSSFKMYDTVLMQHLVDMYDGIHQSLIAEPFYTSMDRNGIMHLSHNHNPAQATQRSAAMTASAQGLAKLRKSLDSFMDHIRDNYLDIDLAVFDRSAREDYKRRSGYER